MKQNILDEITNKAMPAIEYLFYNALKAAAKDSESEKIAIEIDMQVMSKIFFQSDWNTIRTKIIDYLD